MVPAIDTGDAEGQVNVVLASDEDADMDLEPFLIDIKRFLSGKDMVTQDPRLRRNSNQAGRNFLLWVDQLFRRTTLGPKIFIPRELRPRVLRMFHDSIGHWDKKTTRQFITERFWWPHMVSKL